MCTMLSTLFLPAGFQLAIVVLLSIAPFISAIPSPPQPGLHSREDGLGLPDGWVDLGCYSDNSSQPTLTSLLYTDYDKDMMTVGFCTNHCNDNKKALAGLEDGNLCYCGNTMTDGSTKAPPMNCSSKCAGNPEEFCGGTENLNLYWNNVKLQSSPTMPQHVSSWTLKGCFEDLYDARTLKMPMLPGPNGNNAESCIQSCAYADYLLAGMGFGQECWCGNTINFNRKPIDPMYCMLACPGNSLEICGGPNSITIYAAPKP